MHNKHILKIIGELGFVEIYKKGKILITPPAINVHHTRMDPFIQFLVDYKRQYPDFRFRGYFTLYDAWREHAEPSNNHILSRCNSKQLHEYVGVGSIGEPGRFIQPFHLKDQFPIFNHKVLAFGRHKNDYQTVLIPDTDFLKTRGYVDLRLQIDDDDISWEQKRNYLYWRGAPHGFPYQAYDPEIRRSQRTLLIEWCRDHGDICDAVFSCSTSKKDQLCFKYLIDVDGEVNAWSGLFWKLYSRSLVFKVESHYEQWYYNQLKPWEHYIPVKGDFSDFSSRYEWAIRNDEECRSIADNGRTFATQLTYESAVRSFRAVLTH